MTATLTSCALAFGLALGLSASQARAQMAGEQCFPACRKGFVCSRAQCVSACNPECPNGTACVDADCVPLESVGPLEAPPPPLTPAGASGRLTLVPLAPAAAPLPAGPHSAADEAPIEPGRRGAREHDRFYLRAGIGAGGGSFAGNVSSPDYAPTDGAGADGQGLAIPLMLAVGGTPVRGLVVGGSSFAVVIPAPTARLKNYGLERELASGPVVLSSIGPFVDYYFHPKVGFHVQGGFGVALAAVAASKDESTPDRVAGEDNSGIGWSALLGVGYDLWIADQLSLGLLGCAQYGMAWLNAKDGKSSTDINFFVPALLATLTYH